MSGGSRNSLGELTHCLGGVCVYFNFTLNSVGYLRA